MRRVVVMVMVATLATVALAVCPESCVCRRGVVNCANKDLSHVPDNIPQDAVEINLSFNNIEEVNSGTFNHFQTLRKLSLNHNKIFFVEEGSFEGLSALMILDLKNNELPQLDTHVFQGLVSLTKLDLSHNLLETLTHDVIKDLSSLINLNLENNPLTCDCELSWMVRLINQRLIHPLPLCQHPRGLRGLSLLVLDSHSRVACREPIITTPPSDAEARVGESVAFECGVVGDPAPTVVWLKNNVLLEIDNSRLLVLEDGSLIMKDVVGHDGGAYKCVATNAVTKTMSNSAQLRVLDLTLPSVPVITRKPQDRSVVENEGATLQCGAVGHPSPTIDWTFNGRTVTIDPRFYINQAGSLVMERIKAIDAGLYKCVASNRIGTVFEFARLQVFIAPVFSTLPQSQRVVESHPAFFSCDATGEPLVKITWKKDGQDITTSERLNINPSGTTLSINSVTRFDEGVYECKADNLGGTETVEASLTVVSSALPIFSRVSANVTTYIGNSIRLQCEVGSGDPVPVVKWSRMDEHLPLTTNAKYEVGRDGVLVVRELEYSDDGVYVCTAENVAGIIMDYVSVTVRDPRFSPIDNNAIGDTVNIVRGQVNAAIDRTASDLQRIRHRPQSGHELMRHNRYPLTRALPLARAAEVFEQTIEKMFREMHSGVYYNISFEKNMTYEELLTPNQLILLASLSGCTEHRRVVETCDDLCFHHKYRTFDGTCNNLHTPMAGSSLSPLKRLLPPRYENNFNLPIGWTADKLYNEELIPSARKVSRELLSTKKITPDDTFTHMLMQWGQFLDHDLDFSPTAVSNARFSDGRFCNETCNSQSPCFPIPVDADDPRVSSHRCIGFVRSSPMCGSGMTSTIFSDKAIHRQQVNLLTSFIDASMVYGSSEEDASNLRNHNTDQGLLRVGVPSNYNRQKKLLPPNQGEFIDCQIDPNRQHVPCFQAGDHRVNEQLGLTSMHTIWFREHNRLAGLLKRMNSHWDGDNTYHETRKIVGAMIQHITYEYWLPKVLGPSGMKKIGVYKGYKSSVDPSIANAFSTAAFRFGHTLINPILNRLDANFDTINDGNLMLHNAFFAPFRLVEEGGIDPILRGMFSIPAKVKLPGEFINEELTEKLFELAHEVSLDLAAFNVQRGRDHGLPSYNSYRKLCGLREAVTFDDLSREISSKMVRMKLKDLYGHPDNVDLFVGGLAEDSLEGARVGETFTCIIADQFKRLRDGDRFWYEKPGLFSSDQLQEIKKSSLARIICDNSDAIMNIQKDVFTLIKNGSELLDCYSSEMPELDVRAWSQCCQACSRSGDFSSSRSRRSVDQMEVKEDIQNYAEKDKWIENKWKDDGKERNEDLELRLESFDLNVESLHQMIAQLKAEVQYLKDNPKNSNAG